MDLSVTSGTTYRIQVGTEAAASQGTTVSLHVYPRPGLAPLGSAPAFTLSGQDAGRMSSLNLGSVLFNDTTGEYQLQVQTSPRTRIFGILESPETDLPYVAVGEGRFVRGKFHVTYSGPGDSASSTLANLVPNFRMGLRTRAAVNAVLEVQHNAGTGDPGNRDLARELGPSRDESKPSRYAVDLDPVDVPSLLNSSTEGIQRSFELVAALPDYTYVSGTLRVTDASIHTYPALSTGADPSKIYQTGGSNGSSDFNNPSVVTAILGFSRDEILRYFTGSPNPDDYFGPGVINFSIGEAGMNVSASAVTGISVSSVVLPSSRIGLAAVDFTGGNNEDRTNNASRLRTAGGIRHLVSFRLLTTQNSSTVPYIRFRARSVKFAWSSMLELSGARALDSTDGRALLAQVLPGIGNAVSGTNSTANGVWYHMVVPSPLDHRIRQDLQLSGTEPLTTLFPRLAAEPGPGDSAPSRRDLLLGFDVVDTLSFGVEHTAEGANNLRLNRIEVRQFPEMEEQ
jgi:hypothetical protein